jgi:hypothetical protein
MTTLTTEAALLKAAEDSKTAIKGNNPKYFQTKESIHQLTKIFKGYTTNPTYPSAKTDPVREEAAVQRVSPDTEAATDAAPEQRVHTSAPPPQHMVQTANQYSAEFAPLTQEIEDNCPASNTRERSSAHTTTQECIMAALEVPLAHFSAKSVASHTYLIQFLCEFTGAVLERETGEMLEYRHLMKTPKYR